jgi:hypothetical protein
MIFAADAISQVATKMASTIRFPRRMVRVDNCNVAGMACNTTNKDSLKMTLQTEDNHMIVDLHHAFAGLMFALLNKQVSRKAQDRLIYIAARELAEWYRAMTADLKKEKAEQERLRQVGLTIDPATAETTWSYVDFYGCACPDYFGRNPGGEWVNFDDLPEATREALRERDEREQHKAQGEWRYLEAWRD